ncbi:MAG: sigma-70 family RNA polymerase sigma factor [Acidobacteria bacterium]|nr:sigma-70 family RNA polymerase sigma factor [Acidobacteriota bacterium]MBI3470526.1 sigma-70 family RNA polymerase sigma factor [Candidatus Solibacter usitatus]
MEFYSFTAEYVRKLKEGDAEASRHFTTYFSDLMLIKLRSQFRALDDINEVRQATFAKVIEIVQADGVCQPERFGAFVCGVCDNMVKEHRRRTGRTEQMPENCPEPPDRRVDIERELVSDATKKWVRKVLMELLSRRDRELITAIFLEEKDKDEVCRQYGVPREYLRVLLHRAVRRLQKQLAGERGETKWIAGSQRV